MIIVDPVGNSEQYCILKSKPSNWNILPFNSVWSGFHAGERFSHYNDVTMAATASLFTSLTIVCSTVYSSAAQRKHQSSASLAFVRGINRRPVNSPHKWPVTWKMFPFDDVIMETYLPGWAGNDIGQLEWPDTAWIHTMISFERHGVPNPWPTTCLFNSWLRLSPKTHQRSVLLAILREPIGRKFPS